MRNVCKATLRWRRSRKLPVRQGLGYLVQVAVDIGDRITAGQILAVVDIPELSKELAETEAQLDSRRRSLEVAERQIERARPILRSGGNSKTTRESGRWREAMGQRPELDEIRTKTEVSRTDVGVANQPRPRGRPGRFGRRDGRKNAAMFNYSKIGAVRRHCIAKVGQPRRSGPGCDVDTNDAALQGAARRYHQGVL